MTAQGADHAGGPASGSDGEEGGETGSTPPSPAKSEPTGPGARIALRNWRISTRLVSLLALPVAAATTLGVLRIDDSLEKVDQLENMQLLTEMTDKATKLATFLQEERDRSAGPLTSTGNEEDEAVVGPREKTDRAKREFGAATSKIKVDDPALSGVAATVVDITRQLNAIKSIRERAYNEPTYVSQTVNSYNQMIESLLSLSLDMAQATSNSDMIRNTRALAAFSSAKEYASIQRAIIAAGLAREGGPALSESDHRYAVTASESETASRRSFSQIYGEERSMEITRALDSGIVNITSAEQYASRVLKDPDGIKSENRSYMDWFDQDASKIEEMSRIETDLINQMKTEAERLRSEAQQDAFINGAVILLVLGISLVGAFIVARSMVRSLRRLESTAQDVARNRLPELVKQLSEAEPQDVDTSVKSVGVHSRDEIGKVASAFDDVHREAVRLAGEQALLRGNVNAMFTNLSRRSQGLIQRQLSLISELESREADPDQLSSLFKLDHLATRMRRNGENLLVLAGEEPGRRWTRPVPLVDVLRAAASEVEQYERIELNAVPTTEVAGRVVNDLVHLLAELLENATSFSSPQTKVKVTGHALPDGRVLVEIHDTGIGLSPEDLAAINDRLASPPTVDVSVSRRMGLFVVGRLSLRHGIRIQLRPSDSGGTTALVMLPVDVAQGGRPRPPQGTGGPAATLQREPQGATSPGRTGTSGRLGALPPRGQVTGTASRPALPAQSGGGPGGPGAPGGPGGSDRPGGGSGLPQRGQLPSRPGRGSSVGAGGGPGQPSGGGSVDLFGAGPARGAEGAQRTGAPHGSDPESTGRMPRLPMRGGPAGELPGASGPPRRRPGEPTERERVAGAPEATGAGRDHQRESTGEFPPSAFSADPGPGGVGQRRGAPGPGDTAQFARPDFGDPQQGGAPDTARFARPGAGQDTGQHPMPGGPRDTGEHPMPGGPGDTGQHPLVGAGGDTGEYAAPGDPQSTGQFPQPGRPEAPRPANEVRGDGVPGPDQRTPIFESMESNWFNSPRPGGSDQQPPAQAAPPARPQPSPASSGQPAPGPEQQGLQAAGPAGSDHWGASPNDERWRQAEQVRQPAAGGVTTSGLPRRVPRANLVAGTAQQRSDTRPGPQVSRAPDDVRGRLTNLRRGIQQGRQAGGASSGSTDRGFDPTYQQER